MDHRFWIEFTVLLIAATIGSIAILPYSLRLLKESGKSKKQNIPQWLLYLLSVLQNVILFAIIIGIGLIVARQVGLGTPLIDAVFLGKPLNQSIPSVLVIPLLLGLFGGAVLLLMDLRFLPHLPEKLVKTALKTTQWENFTSSFYGGINEEIFMRFLGLSLVAWLLSRIWYIPSHLPTPADLVIANLVMAIIFALGHLPALKTLVDKITPILLLRTMVLNCAIGLICGYVFIRYGIEAAIIVHFTADIVYHVGGTFVLRKKYKQN